MNYEDVKSTNTPSFPEVFLCSSIVAKWRWLMELLVFGKCGILGVCNRLGFWWLRANAYPVKKIINKGLD